MRRRARIQADLYTDASHPPGCLAVNCALPCAGEADPNRRELARLRAASRARLRSRLQEAQLAGDLAADADPDELARFFMVVGLGMAIAAQSGATKADLHQTAVRALAAWPN
jgi:hypothetical protein